MASKMSKVFVQIEGIHDTSLCGNGDMFVVNSSDIESGLKNKIDEKYGIPATHQVLSSNLFAVDISAYIVRDLRTFEIKVKTCGTEQVRGEKCNFENRLYQHRYNYTQHRLETYYNLQRDVEKEATGLPIKQQVFMFDKKGCKELVADQEDKLLSIFESNNGVVGGSLTFYLTSKLGYIGPGSILKYKVNVKAFDSKPREHSILSIDLIFNNLCENAMPGFIYLKRTLEKETGIPRGHQILLDHRYKRIEDKCSSIMLYFRDQLQVNGGEVDLFLTLNPQCTDENVKEVCNSYHIHYLKEVILKSLTTYETFSVTKYHSIKDIQSRIRETRRIPAHAHQIMLNNVKLSTEDTLIDLFTKHFNETGSLAMYLVVLSKLFKLRLVSKHFTFIQNDLTVSDTDTISDVKEKIATLTDNLFPSDYTDVALITNPDGDSDRIPVTPGLTMGEHHVQDGMQLEVTKVIRIVFCHQNKKQSDSIKLKIKHETQTFNDLLTFIEESKGCKRKHLHLRKSNLDDPDISHDALLFKGGIKFSDVAFNELIFDLDRNFGKDKCLLQ